MEKMNDNANSDGRKALKDKVLYPFYVLSHPLDGFYEIRHRGKGSVVVALVILILYSISYTVNKQFAGFYVNGYNPSGINSVLDLQSITIFFFLFCIANWSITCLMEGEGRLKDIVTVVGYSMLPMVLTLVPVTLLSRFIADKEEAFYYLIVNGAMLYFVILLLVGIMTIHNFTLGKTCITLLLTLLAMLMIIFLCLLIYTLIDQMKMFVNSIYTELLFRT